MTGKLAIVTGGGSGLGLAMAKKFCDNGIRTIITGRDVQKLKNAQEVCGENCTGLFLDMTDLKSFPAWVKNVIGQFGNIDILVNNAGINMKKPFLEVSDEDFISIMNTNTVGLFSLSREVVKNMKENGGGCIIHVSSMAAYYGIPYVIAYSASKAAVRGMTLAMAVELAPFGIRVNAVAPGFIKTPMTAKALDSDPERKAKVFGRTPMGRMGDPEDVARAVFFLASEEASFITGEVLRIDGGNAIGF